jgi:thymidine phosphorylase
MKLISPGAAAPASVAAGLAIHVRLGERVECGQPPSPLHAHAPGELACARRYHDTHPAITLEDNLA